MRPATRTCDRVVAPRLDDRPRAVDDTAEVAVARDLEPDRLAATDAFDARPQRDAARGRLAGGDALAERAVARDAPRVAGQRERSAGGVESGDGAGADGGAAHETAAVETWLGHARPVPGNRCGYAAVDEIPTRFGWGSSVAFVRRLIALLLFAALAVGATAVAQDGGESGVPVVRSGAVLHLDGGRTCQGGDGVTLRVTPPPGVELGWLSVRIDGRQIVRLTGVGSGASVTIRLPRRSARVGTSAETLDGQRLARAHRYRSCIKPKPKPSPPQPRRDRPPVIVGGGEA